MEISIVIPTYNRLEKIQNLLQIIRVTNSNIDNFEVIIVNDGSNNYTIKDLQTVIDNSKLNNVSVINQNNQGRSVSRNRGAEKAASDLLLFLDDDMILSEELIQNHIDFHKKNNDSILIGSGYRNPKFTKSDFHKYLVYIESHWKKTTSNYEIIKFDNYSFTACNTSIPKNIFFQLNGFDEKLKDAEDFDLGIRALKQDISIIKSYDLIAWHDDWPELKNYINRHNEYELANKKLIELHPEYKKLFKNLNKEENKKKLKKITICLAANIFKTATSLIGKYMPLKLKFIYYRLAISCYSN